MSSLLELTQTDNIQKSFKDWYQQINATISESGKYEEEVTEYSEKEIKGILSYFPKRDYKCFFKLIDKGRHIYLVVVEKNP